MQEAKVLSPNIEVEEWFQGEPTNIDQERGKIIVIEVFQVNCPGCFISALPEAIQVHHKFKNNKVLSPKFNRLCSISFTAFSGVFFG